MNAQTISSAIEAMLKCTVSELISSRAPTRFSALNSLKSIALAMLE